MRLPASSFGGYDKMEARIAEDALILCGDVPLMPSMIGAEPLPLQTDADGVVRVGGTRVSLETIVVAFQQGAAAEKIAEQYPAVALPDIYAAIAYYLRHRDAVETYVAEGRRQSNALRQDQEASFDRQGIRERLLARRSFSG